MKALVSTVALIVTRDALTILPTTVPVYEAEVVKAVFGEDSVEVREDKTDPVEIEIEDEASRLVARYGQGAVEAAYNANFKGAIAKAVEAAVVKKAK